MAQTKPKINNVTETGPQSYRELQRANEEAFKQASSVSPFAGLKQTGYRQSLDYVYEGGEQSPLMQQTGGTDYWGNSMFDSDSANEEDYNRLSDVRAENEPVIAKAAAGITKGVILAGTTFIDGTVGLLAGIGQGIYNRFSDDLDKHWYQGLWDNPVTNLMGQINEASEEYLPNYRTQEEQDAPWYSLDNLTSANFIFDTVIKNMGFTVGAAFSGGVYTKAISWGAKAIGLGRLAGASAATIEAGQKAMETARATRATKAIVGSFFSAHAEAVQEAYNSSQDFIKTQTQAIENRAWEQKDLAVQEFINSGGTLTEDGVPNPYSNPEAYSRLSKKFADIDEAGEAAKSEIVRQSKNVGTMDGLLNIPVLWLSDVAMFGKMFAGGWKSARNANRTVTKATKEAVKEAKAAARAGDPSKLQKLEEIVAKAEQTGYQGLSEMEKSLVEEVAPHILGKKAGVAWAAAKGPLREGNEEMLQGAASQAANYKYANEVDKIFDAKLDIDATHTTRGVLESVMEGLKSQYGDINNYEEAFVGAITGLLGSPTFGRGNNSTDQTYLGRSKWIGLTGGTFTEVRDYLRDRKNSDMAAQHATEVLRSGQLAGNIKHLIAQTHFNDGMDRAVIHDDEKEYKDARTAATFEMISHLKRAGRLDLLQKAMEATTEFTEEDIAEIVEATQKAVSATTPDVNDKIRQRKRVEKDIETLEENYDEIYAEASHTGDSSNLDAWQETMDAKKAELASLEADINAAKPVTISPYIHKDGTAYTAEEVKQDIDKRVQQFQKIIDTITLSQEQIDEATSERLTDEQLDTLTWYKVMMNDWDERANGITEQWKDVIDKLANNPTLVQSIEAIKEVEDLLEEAGFDPTKANIQLGGRFDQLNRLKDHYNLLRKLQEAVEKGGLNLAYILTNPSKLSGTEYTVGEFISKAFEQVLQTNQSMSKDIKDAFIKNLNDLKSIGQGHRKYNELLDEYLKNPEKIDQAHQASENRTQSESSRQNLSNTIDGVDWNSPVGTIAKYLKDNASKIQNAGGFEKFIENLTPEQKRKAREAQKLIMGIDSLDSLIDEAGLEDEQAQILRSIIDDSIDDADTIKQLADSVKDAIQGGVVEDLIKRSVPEDQPEDLTLRQIEAAEIALSEFMDDNLEKLVNATEEAQRAMDAEQERVRRLAEQTEDSNEDEIRRLASDTTESGGPTEAPSEEEVDDTAGDPQTAPVVNPATPTSAKRVNKSARKQPQAGLEGYNRRRQVSQYYLNGEDRETLPKHYEEHPEDIPAGVDKDAFLKYIKAVHKKLVESGAYTYISGVNPNLRLKQGQEIRFTTDKKLNEDAGVTVILMVTTDEQGNEQIIGSLPTSLDFQSKKRGSTKTVGEIHPEDKALYDTIVEELKSDSEAEQPKFSSITTKVEALRGGSPSFSSQNRSVSEVFGETPVAITIISGNSRTSEAVKNPMDIADPINGQVYVYVTANTGAQIPLLCFSTPLKDLATNDWYIEQTVQAIQKLQDAASIGSTKMEILKWLPFLDNLHINVEEKNGQKSILFGWGRNKDGRIANSYSIKLQEDGSISQKDALAFVKSISGRKITLPSGEKIYPTTNVDHNRLRDKDYMSNITRYIKVNITSDSPRTIDDWFTYEPTDIQKQKKAPSKTNPAVTPSGKVSTTEEVDTPVGPAAVSNVGTVTVEGDGVLTQAEEEAILANIPKGEDASDTDKNSGGTSIEGLFGAGTSEVDDMPDTPRRRRRKPKTLLVSDTEDSVATTQELSQDMEKLSTMFPKLAKEGRIVLVKGLISVVDEKGNPREAYGLFKNGVLYISDQSPKGTAFHEAFHYITDTLLDTEEKKTMFSEASKMFGSLPQIELEEKLAEAFREFMNERQDHSVKGRLKTVFQKLKHIVLSLVGKENYLDNLFWSIYRDKMQNRRDNTSEDTYKQELLEYKTKKLKYSNLDQETKDYLAARKFSEDNYEKLSIEQKEILLQCM